ncbi:lipid-A-disaccharide synthase N-terminal domain-containing protein [Singulisphaera acidiphila]|uniref:Putative membrane protein n=1 Tax=Singulisphaera acidiphila (strain ATCC BAA-1392 / DSM 18658 / VKM B-2454 / MOB10) TaxID=886293 RepID=L0DEZ5_SINAD|nr:lipid-A-disaccharide synthase N-terminal domain-containing protein [Singulisphaera acidiphila]AGA27944.1 putative membrane protein [Singulisphaera acidiphila DSM 18658]
MSDLSRLFSDLWSVLWGMSLWVKIGFLGQAAFTARFLVQWVASEKKKASVVPVAFWWLSIVGGVVLLAYAIHNRDPVIIVGQATGLLVYIRNLMLVQRARSRGTKRTKKEQGESAESASISRPHRVDSSAKKIPWS